jgi:hypothetical protein
MRQGRQGSRAEGATRQDGQGPGALCRGRKGGERGGRGEGEAYHRLDGRQQPLTGDPNESRERVGERRKRERVVSLFLDHGCAGKGNGGGGMHGAVVWARGPGWAGPGLSHGADSPLLELACF